MVNIKVIGIGGGGCNAVSRMNNKNLKGVDLIAVNTDAQVLRKSKVPVKLLIGEKVTGGLGAGMNYGLGKKAAQESTDLLRKTLKSADIVFLTAGLGGGTGSPGISVIGKIARDLGALTIAVVTRPFAFEGGLRSRMASRGLKELKGSVDALFDIANDKILEVVGKKTPVDAAFLKCDEVLIKAVQGISDLLTVPGIISLDFADLEEIIKNSGRALFGIGKAKGEGRALAAAKASLYSPLFDFSIKRASGILFNVSGQGLTLFEVNEVANFIRKIADKNTKIIFGVSEPTNQQDLRKGELKVTLIATGIE